jgi:CDP-glucose 4,6-dehydratase
MGIREGAVEDLGIDPAFWKDKSVFVTGHTGFKGGWLSIWLERLGAKVTGCSLDPDTDPSLFEEARVAESVKSVIADIRDIDNLRKIFGEDSFDVVIHMAAQSLVRVSYREPVETYATNVMGTVNLLESVRQSGQKPAVVVVTSDKCYENRERPEGYREQDPMGGYDPYSSSKGCAELVCSAYRRAFLDAEGINMASARSGNVIGGGDWAEDRLLPDCARAFLKHDPVYIRYPNATRPWQHVLEPLGGYLMLARGLVEHGSGFAGAWNFGPDEQDVESVWRVATHFAAFWGAPAEVEKDKADHPHEAQQLILNCDKAKTELGWRARTKLDEALEWTAEWYKNVAGGADGRGQCLSQIERFMDRGN